MSRIYFSFGALSLPFFVSLKSPKCSRGWIPTAHLLWLDKILLQTKLVFLTIVNAAYIQIHSKSLLITVYTLTLFVHFLRYSNADSVGFQTEKQSGRSGRARSVLRCPGQGPRRGEDQTDPGQDRLHVRRHHRSVTPLNVTWTPRIRSLIKLSEVVTQLSTRFPNCLCILNKCLKYVPFISC